MLNKKVVGITTGIFWGGTVFIFVLGNLLFGWWNTTVTSISGFYLGLALSSYTGLIFGTLVASIDGFIGGWIFAWLYNKVEKKWK